MTCLLHEFHHVAAASTSPHLFVEPEGRELAILAAWNAGTLMIQTP